MLALLLVVTISYCWKLQRRLRIIQSSKSDLARLMKLFDECTERASKSIGDLQAVSKRVSDSLAVRMDKANTVADDLHFLIDKAGKLANDLEKKVSVMQHNQKVISELERYTAKPFKTAETKPDYLPPALPPAAPPSRPALQEKVASLDGQAKTASSLESLLEKISAKPEPSASAGAAAREFKMAANSNMQLRTQAERELYEALKRNK